MARPARALRPGRDDAPGGSRGGLSGRPVPAGLAPVMTFREAEGTTLVLRREEAEAAGLAGIFPSRLITLGVHSALDAVGFLAAVAQRLAREGIGVNPVAAFHHDHLFVPVDRAEDALRALADLGPGGGPGLTAD